MIIFIFLLKPSFPTRLFISPNVALNKLFNMNKLILVLFLFFTCSYMFPPNPTPLPQRQNIGELDRMYTKIGLNWISTSQIILFGFGLVSCFWLILLVLCDQVKYVSFNTNLTLVKKRLNLTFPKLWLYLPLVLVGLLVSEYPEAFSIHFFLHYCRSVSFSLKLNPNVIKLLARGCYHTTCALIFTDAVSHATLILSVFVF